MKGIGSLLVLVVIALGAWYLFGDMLPGGGSADPGSLTDRVPPVDPNDAADRARDGANSAANTVAGLSPTAWSVILIGVAAAAAVTLWGKSAKFKWGVIGAVAALVVVVVLL